MSTPPPYAVDTSHVAAPAGPGAWPRPGMSIHPSTVYGRPAVAGLDGDEPARAQRDDAHLVDHRDQRGREGRVHRVPAGQRDLLGGVGGRLVRCGHGQGGHGSTLAAAFGGTGHTGARESTGPSRRGASCSWSPSCSLINVPYALHQWQLHRVATDGIQVTATVVVGRRRGDDVVLAFRLPASVDPSRPCGPPGSTRPPVPPPSARARSTSGSSRVIPRSTSSTARSGATARPILTLGADVLVAAAWSLLSWRLGGRLRRPALVGGGRSSDVRGR